MTNAVSGSAACEDMHLLIQADLDGELDAAATAVLAAHVQDCPGCTALQRDLTALSARMRTELHPEAAPAALRRTLEARLRPAPPPTTGIFLRWLAPLLSFGTGAAVAASMLLMLPSGGDGSAELVSSHIRALQPGHLTDVLSSDQHTVKPWFDGRIDYAPPVKDFAAAGFPLIGGRLDYVGGRTVAVLAYRRDKHAIDLYVWPGDGASGPTSETRNGYNIMRWSQGGMQFRAVSDVERTELSAFTRLWQQTPAM
jgi:anti-sigma factor RsiW